MHWGIAVSVDTKDRAVDEPTVGKQPSVLEKGRELSRLSIDECWRSLIEEVCVLKEALDHVTRWPAHAHEQPWIAEALRKVGLHETDFEDTKTEPGLGAPHSFVKLVLGSWFTYRDTTSEIFRGLADMPEWSTVGWVRKDAYRHTSAMPQPEIVATAREVLASYNERERVRTYGFEGIPLLWAGEGKNRTQLFRMAGVPRRSELVLYPRPDVSGLVASRLLGMPGMTVLTRGGVSEVLPFGDLSRRLLLAMGVRWSEKPSLKGWPNMRSCGGMSLGLSNLARLGRDEKRTRLAMIGGLGLAGLSKSET